MSDSVSICVDDSVPAEMRVEVLEWRDEDCEER